MVGSSEVSVSGGCQETDMTQDLLPLNQINARLQKMSGIAVAQGMTRDFFLSPILSTTFLMVT